MSIASAYIEGELQDVDALDWFRRADDEVRRQAAEFAREHQALLCWHHLYRWPALRHAAWMAHTKERYEFLMYLADHAKP